LIDDERSGPINHLLITGDVSRARVNGVLVPVRENIRIRHRITPLERR